MKSPAVLLLCFCLVAPAVAAPPVDELLRYVPADVTFCLTIRDLRGHLDALTKSPFAEQMRGKALKAAPELENLLAGQKPVNASTGRRQGAAVGLAQSARLRRRPGGPRGQGRRWRQGVPQDIPRLLEGARRCRPDAVADARSGAWPGAQGPARRSTGA